MSKDMSASDIMRLKLTSKFFKCFADYSRLCIFECLLDGEKTVSEIVEFTGFTQSKISNHLKCLREGELVSTRQDGKHIFYEVKDEKIQTILSIANEFLKDSSEKTYNCMK